VKDFAFEKRVEGVNTLLPAAMKSSLVLLVSAAVFLSNTAGVAAGEATPVPTPEPTPHQWDLRVAGGQLVRKEGGALPATLRNVVDYLVELQPANVVLAPSLGEVEIVDLKLAGLRWEGALEALRIASGNAFIWSSQPPAETIDPATGMPMRPTSPGEASLYVLEPAPGGPRALNERAVEVFNLSGYLAGKEGNQITETLDELKLILGESLHQVWAGTRPAQAEPVPSVRFHSSASLLVVVGTPPQIEIARKIILALPGTSPSQAGAGMGSGFGGMGGGGNYPIGGGMVGGGMGTSVQGGRYGGGGFGGGMDERMMRRYGLIPERLPADEARTLHTVQPGETLDGIARLHGTRTEVLQAANPGLDPQGLRVGQALRIPARVLQTPANVPKPPGVGMGGTSQPPPSSSSSLPPALAPPPPAK